MTDTAQPETAAETEVASDPFADAANAFKAYDAPPPRPRDEQGRFAPTQEQPETEIEAEADETAEAESHDEVETDEAAEEAQLEPVDLPPSWPSEQAEMWTTLPPETQAFIREREGEREAAINAKFQEAANVRKANEAVITEAQANRQQFVEATEFVLSLANPQEPSTSMLNPASADYNPDAYHLKMAEYKEAAKLISSLQQQRDQALAQQQREAAAEHFARIEEVNERYGPALLKDVPDINDPQRAPAAIQSLAQYAVKIGIPEEQFTVPENRANITAPMLHLIWKAQQFDKMNEAKGKVVPKAAKPAAPPVKPGVATPRSAVEGAQRKTALDRLGRTGSVEDGAAVWKQFLKG